jgi:hypothetical protein
MNQVDEFLHLFSFFICLVSNDVNFYFIHYLLLNTISLLYVKCQ